MQTLATLPAPVPAGGHFPWLSVVTFAPLAGAVVLAFFPKANLRGVRLWSLAVTILTLALALAMLQMRQSIDATARHNSNMSATAMWPPAM